MDFSSESGSVCGLFYSQSIYLSSLTDKNIFIREEPAEESKYELGDFLEKIGLTEESEEVEEVAYEDYLDEIVKKEASREQKDRGEAINMKKEASGEQRDRGEAINMKKEASGEQRDRGEAINMKKEVSCEQNKRGEARIINKEAHAKHKVRKKALGVNIETLKNLQCQEVVLEEKKENLNKLIMQIKELKEEEDVSESSIVENKGRFMKKLAWFQRLYYNLKSFRSQFSFNIHNSYPLKDYEGSKIFQSKSSKTILQKIISFVKENYKLKEKLNSQNENDFQSIFDTNTNKPCNCTRTTKENSDEGENQRPAKISSNISQVEDESDSEDSAQNSSKNYKASESDSSSLKLRISKEDSLEEEKKSKTEYSNENIKLATSPTIPLLITNRTRSYRRKVSLIESTVHEGRSLYSYIDMLTKKFPRKSFIPISYKKAYKFYIYMYPSHTDGNLLIFQREKLKSISKLMDPYDVLKLIYDTKSDFLFDRRLRMVQIQCKCFIILEPLSHVYINGLPYRLINIYSSSYENIAKALSIMEDIMPEIMQRCVFKDELPSAYSAKWATKAIIVRPIKKFLRTENANKTWLKRIEPGLRFSSFNYTLENYETKYTNKKNISIKPPEVKIFRKILKFNHNNYNSVDELSHSKTKENITQYYAIKSKSELKTEKIDDLNNNINIIEYNHKKRIKCPIYILNKKCFENFNDLQLLFAEFQCKIVGVQSSEDDQIKITVLYNSKEYLYKFCNSIGLSLKPK